MCVLLRIGLDCAQVVEGIRVHLHDRQLQVLHNGRHLTDAAGRWNRGGVHAGQWLFAELRYGAMLSETMRMLTGWVVEDIVQSVEQHPHDAVVAEGAAHALCAVLQGLPTRILSTKASNRIVSMVSRLDPPSMLMVG